MSTNLSQVWTDGEDGGTEVRVTISTFKDVPAGVWEHDVVHIVRAVEMFLDHLKAEA